MLEEKNIKKSYPQNQVRNLTNIWLYYMAFMAFKLKPISFPIKLTPNDPIQGKKSQNVEILGLGLWVCPSKKFMALYYFIFSSLVCKKSSHSVKK